MAKFRKKPVEIEAYQVTRELLEGVLFDGKIYPKGLRVSSCSYNEERRYISAWFGSVTTIHNQDTKVIEGDWIITEPDGEHFYPCKPDIFLKTYECAEAAVEDGKKNWKRHVILWIRPAFLFLLIMCLFICIALILTCLGW